MKRKRVALFYPWCYLQSGVERVILETVQRSRHEYTVFTNHIDYAQTFPEFRAMGNVIELKRVPVERSFRKVIAATWTILTQKLPLEGYDALLVQSEGLGDFVCFRNHGKPVLSFCHTPVRPIYDPIYRREWIAKHPRKRLLLEAFSALYRPLNRLAWCYYRRVFPNSTEVRNRILAGGLCPPERLEVLNPGVDLDGIRPGGPRERYFLYAGRIKWTKNVELALDAFADFRRREAERPGGEPDAWRLVVAGGVDQASREYFAGLEARAATIPGVEFRLSPPRQALDDLYSRCWALLYPPLNEDWGIVPIEAMAFGRPVLAVDSGGPRETVAHGRTGYLLEPRAEAFGAAMARLAADPALTTELGDAAAQRARLFTWDAFVKRLDDYVDTL